MKKFSAYLSSNYFKFFALIFIALVFQQCNFIGSLFEEEELVFDPWEHPVYEKDDTIMFSNDLLVDSFLVIQSEAGDVRDFGASFEEAYDGYEGLLKHINGIDSARINMIIKITPFYYYWYYYYGNLKVPYKGERDIWNSVSSDFKDSVAIDGIVLKDVYEMNFVCKQFSDLHIEVTSAFFSKSLGLIQYTKHTGEVFTISEESLEMLMAREWPVVH